MRLLALLVGTSASETATDAEAQRRKMEGGGGVFRVPCQVGEIPRKSALLPWVLNIS